MIKSLFGSKKQFFATKTFTYFIPAPPNRRTGYQEKEFDSIANQVANMGYTIISINTAAYANVDKCGMWIVCLLGAPTKEIFEKEVLFDPSSEGTTQAKEQYVPLDPNIIHE